MRVIVRIFDEAYAAFVELGEKTLPGGRNCFGCAQTVDTGLEQLPADACAHEQRCAQA